MEEKVTREGRTLAYEGVILKVYRDHMRFANGDTADWDFIHHDGACAIVPVLEDGRILMVRQFRNALDRETLEIPAGKLEQEDESPLSCAARELEEETGYACDRMKWLITLRSTVAFCDEKISVYVAQNLRSSSQHLDKDEYLKIIPCTFDELKERIYQGEIEDAKTIAALLAYEDQYLKT